MSFTLIGKHEKDPRANRDGYVTAMLEMMEKDPTVMHVDCVALVFRQTQQFKTPQARLLFQSEFIQEAQ